MWDSTCVIQIQAELAYAAFTAYFTKILSDPQTLKAIVPPSARFLPKPANELRAKKERSERKLQIITNCTQNQVKPRHFKM